MSEYRISTEPGTRSAQVRVIGPDQGRMFTATAWLADPEALGGPEPGSVSWQSIGNVPPEAAKAVAEAILTAAELAQA